MPGGATHTLESHDEVVNKEFIAYVSSSNLPAEVDIVGFWEVCMASSQ